MKPSDRLPAALVLLLAGGLRLHRAGLLGAQADEGVHLYVASQVAAGAVLYRDLFENRTPLAEWLLALLVRLVGPELFAARLLAVAAGLLAVAGIIAAARLAGGDRRSSLIGALLFALSPLAVFWGRFALLEPFAVLFSVLSLAAALAAWRRQDGRWWLASGFLAALALLAKQTAAIFVVLMALFLLLAARRGLLRWLAGWALPVVAFGALLLAQGAWKPFWSFASGAGRLATDVSWAAAAGMWLDWAVRQPLGPLLLVAALLTLFNSRPALFAAPAALPLAGLLGVWAAAEWLALLLVPGLELGWGGFSHYLLPFLAASALFVGAGLGLARRLPGNRTLLVGGALLVLLTLPAWWSDFRHAVWQTAYPQPDRSAEREIGRAAALLTPEQQPLLVMGNAAVYLAAEREAASRFFHLPAYLGSSDLAQSVDQALQEALRSGDTGAVVVSGLHLDERLSPALAGTLWQHWTPAARFSYPYQRDLFLFRPRERPAPGGQPARPADVLARFGDGIALHSLDAALLDERTLLVTALWEAETPPDGDLVVFTHLLGPGGALLAQHDGVPAVGFRPTSGWQPGERIADDHWIELPAGAALAEATLSVGLYRPADLSRLDRSDGSGQNSYLMPLELP